MEAGIMSFMRDTITVTLYLVILFFVAFLVQTAECHVFQVGPARTYAQPSDVASLVQNSDTVEIDPGTYTDCATWNKNNLFLMGAGPGYTHLENSVCGQKGIWVIYGNNETVENIEFSGASISQSAGNNGAGIRAQGGSFTIRHCFFHDNQDGILSDPDSAGRTVLIEYSIFDNNGAGDGYSHNMYIGSNGAVRYASFTLQYCYTHRANIGNNIKSRADRNFILYNRIMDEDAPTSWDIDLPNGGQAFITGNEIEKGPNAQQHGTMEFGLEGLSNAPPQNLFIASNTFINDAGRGTYVNIPSSGVDTLEIVNNIFAGVNQNAMISNMPALLDSVANLVSASIPSVSLVNAAGYDYHLAKNSPAVGKGIPPGAADGSSLAPVDEYLDTANMKPRVIVGAIDQGAHEYTASNDITEQQFSVSAFGVTVVQNQSSGTLDFYIPISYIRNIVLSVFDILGRRIASYVGTPFSERMNGEKIQLSTSGMKTGIYFAQIVSPQGTAFVKYLLIK